jgi:hypothetical protein
MRPTMNSSTHRSLALSTLLSLLTLAVGCGGASPEGEGTNPEERAVGHTASSLSGGAGGGGAAAADAGTTTGAGCAQITQLDSIPGVIHGVGLPNISTKFKESVACAGGAWTGSLRVDFAEVATSRVTSSVFGFYLNDNSYSADAISGALKWGTDYTVTMTMKDNTGLVIAVSSAVVTTLTSGGANL